MASHNRYDITQVEDIIKEMKILVIDDDKIMRNVLKKTLEEAGYKISCVSNSKEALEIISRDIPDIILMDLVMPDIDGFELCRRLKDDKKSCHIPVIFITVKGDTDDMIQGFKLGCVDYIVKPFRKEDVVARVKTHLYTVYLRKEVEKQSLFKGVIEMAGATAHELNQPLAVILGISQLLTMNSSLDNEMREQLTIIEKQAGKMADIIRKIANITKYKVKEYIEGINIIDIEKSSEDYGFGDL